MRGRILAVAGAVALSLVAVSRADWKKVVHLATLPVIEGGGIYSSVAVLNASNDPFTTAAAVSTLAALGTQATLGAITMFGKPANYEAWARAHRLVAYAVTATAVALSVAAASDNSVDDTDKGIPHAYTGLTLVPLIVFEF